MADEHTREVRWLLDRCARQFVEQGTWPDTSQVVRDAARADIELDGFFYASTPREFLFRRDHNGVVLSVLGLERTQLAEPLVDALVRFVRLCTELYLGDDDQPKVTADMLRDNLGMDEATIDRLYQLFTGTEYFLTASGGGQDSTNWSFELNDLVRKFRGVESLEQYLTVRHSILSPQQPLPAAVLPAEFLTEEAELGYVELEQAEGTSETNKSSAPSDSPVAFVSWAHDDETWEASVHEFTDLLRAEGIDAHVDLYDKNKAIDWQQYGIDQITRSDLVIAVTSKAYVERWRHQSQPGVGAGVAREAVVIRHIFDMDPARLVEKVFVVVLPGVAFGCVPSDLAHLPRIQVSELTRDGIDGVFRQVVGDAEYPKPSLGPLLPRGPRRAGGTHSTDSIGVHGDAISAEIEVEGMVAEVKTMLASGKVRIELRDLLLDEVKKLRSHLESLVLENQSNLTEAYRQCIEEVVRRVQPLAGGLAAGCFYGEPEHRALWVEVLRSVAQQAEAMSGAVWTRWIALRRLPATLLLYAGVLGAWRATDLKTMIDLSSTPLQHSFPDTRITIRQLAECPAFVALAPPEVLDQELLGMGPAGGPIQLSNEIWASISPVLVAEYPVSTELAMSFEDVEYLLALMQYDWHVSNKVEAHTRWEQQHFHRGLVDVRSAYVGVPPSRAGSRFNAREGPLSTTNLINAGLFGCSWDRLGQAVTGIGLRLL